MQAEDGDEAQEIFKCLIEIAERHAALFRPYLAPLFEIGLRLLNDEVWWRDFHLRPLSFFFFSTIV